MVTVLVTTFTNCTLQIDYYAHTTDLKLLFTVFSAVLETISMKCAPYLKIL